MTNEAVGQRSQGELLAFAARERKEVTKLELEEGQKVRLPSLDIRLSLSLSLSTLAARYKTLTGAQVH